MVNTIYHLFVGVSNLFYTPSQLIMSSRPSTSLFIIYNMLNQQNIHPIDMPFFAIIRTRNKDKSMHIPYTERIYKQKRDSCSSKLVHFKKKCFLIFRKKTRNKRIKQISFLENEKQNQKTRNKDIIKQTTNKVIMRVSFV